MQPPSSADKLHGSRLAWPLWWWQSEDRALGFTGPLTMLDLTASAQSPESPAGKRSAKSKHS